MRSLGLDIGYGDVKVVFGDEKIKKIFKFPSAIAQVDSSDLLTDSRLQEHNSKHYYVGDLALRFSSASMRDISGYEELERYSSLFLKQALEEIEDSPEIIVFGLSMAQYSNKDKFLGILRESLKNTPLSSANLEILPQGIGAKVAMDFYGFDFPKLSTSLNSELNYVGCDIGFNTLDIFQVVSGEASPSLVRGIENMGFVKIAKKVQEFVQKEFNKEISLPEAKEIIDHQGYRRRNKFIDMKDVLKVMKSEYLKELEEVIESNFSNALDKADFLGIFGGGAYIFTSDDFYKTPKFHGEFYNAIGFFHYPEVS